MNNETTRTKIGPDDIGKLVRVGDLPEGAVLRSDDGCDYVVSGVPCADPGSVRMIRHNAAWPATAPWWPSTRDAQMRLVSLPAPVAPPSAAEQESAAHWYAEVVKLRAEVARLTRIVAVLRDDDAALDGLRDNHTALALEVARLTAERDEAVRNATAWQVQHDETEERLKGERDEARHNYLGAMADIAEMCTAMREPDTIRPVSKAREWAKRIDRMKTELREALDGRQREKDEADALLADTVWAYCDVDPWSNLRPCPYCWGPDTPKHPCKCGEADLLGSVGMR